MYVAMYFLGFVRIEPHNPGDAYVPHKKAVEGLDQVKTKHKLTDFEKRHMTVFDLPSSISLFTCLVIFWLFVRDRLWSFITHFICSL